MGDEATAVTPQLSLGLAGAAAALSMGAEFSPCRRYRYRLWRTWGDPRELLLLVMLNPSTADASADDPTIRRCIAFAKRWKHGALEVVNLFAWRSTDPDELLDVPDPVGPGNDEVVLAAARGARRVIAAWGAHRAAQERAPTVLRLLAGAGVVAYHLGLNEDGSPKHPLARGRHRIPDDIVPQPFGAR